MDVCLNVSHMTACVFNTQYVFCVTKVFLNQIFSNILYCCDQAKHIQARPKSVCGCRYMNLLLNSQNLSQVQRQSVYLTDDANVAIFPQPHGSFNCFDLNDRGHYEVHGDSVTVERPAGALPSDHPVRFSFHRLPSTAASSSSPIPRATMTKAFQR